MTTPRDLIEAPATDKYAEKLLQQIRAFMPNDQQRRTTANLSNTLAVARDEGRQEAVRLIRERIEGLDWTHQGDHVVLRWIDIRAILDEVARHGRSSDPEPAPHYEQINGVTYERTADGHLRLPEPAPACEFLTYRDGSVDCLTHRWGGSEAPITGQCPSTELRADPALQAAGEPLE